MLFLNTESNARGYKSDLNNILKNLRIWTVKESIQTAFKNQNLNPESIYLIFVLNVSLSNDGYSNHLSSIQIALN